LNQNCAPAIASIMFAFQRWNNTWTPTTTPAPFTEENTYPPAGVDRDYWITIFSEVTMGITTLLAILMMLLYGYIIRRRRFEVWKALPSMVHSVLEQKNPDRPWYFELGLNNTVLARRKLFGRSRIDPSTVITARLQHLRDSKGAGDRFLKVVVEAVKKFRVEKYGDKIAKDMGMSLVERIWEEQPDWDQIGIGAAYAASAASSAASTTPRPQLVHSVYNNTQPRRTAGTLTQGKVELLREIVQAQRKRAKKQILKEQVAFSGSDDSDVDADDVNELESSPLLATDAASQGRVSFNGRFTRTTGKFQKGLPPVRTTKFSRVSVGHQDSLSFSLDRPGRSTRTKSVKSITRPVLTQLEYSSDIIDSTRQSRAHNDAMMTLAKRSSRAREGWFGPRLTHKDRKVLEEVLAKHDIGKSGMMSAISENISEEEEEIMKTRKITLSSSTSSRAKMQNVVKTLSRSANLKKKNKNLDQIVPCTRKLSDIEKFIRFCNGSSDSGNSGSGYGLGYNSRNYYSKEEKRILAILPEALHRERFLHYDWWTYMTSRNFSLKPSCTLLGLENPSLPPYGSFNKWTKSENEKIKTRLVLKSSFGDEGGGLKAKLSSEVDYDYFLVYKGKYDNNDNTDDKSRITNSDITPSEKHGNSVTTTKSSAVVSNLAASNEQRGSQKVSWSHLGTSRNSSQLDENSTRKSENSSQPNQQPKVQIEWPIPEYSEYNSIGETPVLWLCWYFVRFIYNSSPGVKAMTRWGLFCRALLGLIPTVQAIAAAYFIMTCFKIRNQHERSREMYVQWCANSVINEDGGDVQDLFANGTTWNADSTKAAGYRSFKNETEFFAAMGINQKGKFDIYVGGGYWEGKNEFEWSKVNRIAKCVAYNSLEELDWRWIFQAFMWVIILRLLPLMAIRFQWHADMYQAYNGLKHELRQVVMTELLWWRCEQANKKMEEVSNNNVSKNANELGGKADVGSKNARVNNNKEAAGVEITAQGMTKQEDAGGEDAGGVIVDDTNTLEASSSSAEQFESSAYKAEEPLQKKSNIVSDSKTEYYEVHSKQSVIAGGAEPPAEEEDELTKLLDTAADADVNNTTTNATTNVSTDKQNYANIRSNNNANSLASQGKLSDSTSPESKLKLYAQNYTHQQHSDTTFQDTPGKCVVILTTFIDDIIDYVWCPIFDVVESTSRVLATFIMIVPEFTAKHLYDYSSGWLVGGLVFFFLCGLLGLYLNFKFRLRDAIDYWSLTAKWKVNHSSMAGEVLRRTDMLNEQLIKEAKLDNSKRRGSSSTNRKKSNLGDNDSGRVSRKFGSNLEEDSGITLGTGGVQFDSKHLDGPVTGRGPTSATTGRHLRGSVDFDESHIDDHDDDDNYSTNDMSNKNLRQKSLLNNLWQDRAKTYGHTSLIMKNRETHCWCVSTVVPHGARIFQAVLEMGVMIFIVAELVCDRLTCMQLVLFGNALLGIQSAITVVENVVSRVPRGYSSLLYVAQCINVGEREIPNGCKFKVHAVQI